MRNMNLKFHFQGGQVSIFKDLDEDFIKNIYSILVLDGWGDYKEKMTINKKFFLPNKIIFFDLLAQKIIKNFKFSNKVRS